MPILVFIIRISGICISKFSGSGGFDVSPRGVVYCFHEFFQTISLCRLEQPGLLIPPVVVQSSHGVGRSKLAPGKMELFTEGRTIQIMRKKVMILYGVVSGE